jgi:pimeloyl-ACP methyl ester carboxylesterase
MAAAKRAGFNVVTTAIRVVAVFVVRQTKRLQAALYRVLQPTLPARFVRRIAVRRVRRRAERARQQRTILTSRTPSDEALLVLKVHDLQQAWKAAPLDALRELDRLNTGVPDRETVFALMELCYAAARRMHRDKAMAARLLLSCVVYSYQFLFEPRYGAPLSAFHPYTRFACDLYNQALEDFLCDLRRRKQRIYAGQRLPLLHGVLDLQRKDSFLMWSFADISGFELASELEVSGLDGHYAIEGIGVPLVVIRDVAGQAVTGESFLPGIRQTCSATALLKVTGPFDDGAGNMTVYRGEGALYDAVREETLTEAGVTLPLKADFATPLAYMMTRTPDPVSFVAMLDAEEWRHETGLHMMQPYQPDRIPIVFVHGLMSSPFTWLRMLITLMADRTISAQYQLWFYMYPTGNPILYSAQILRQSLRDMQRRYDPSGTNPNFNQMVLVGHSMGGLISKLQVVDSGDHIWRAFAHVEPETLHLTDAERTLIEAALVFAALPWITRVVFIATPHCGSIFASSWYARLGAVVTRMNEDWEHASGAAMRRISAQAGAALDPTFRKIIARRMPTGIDGLLPSNPMLHATLALPLAPRVTCHSIIGNQRAGGEAGGSDGTVAYASAHFAPAVSEVIVKSDHGAHAHPLAIREVRRILLEHVQSRITEEA